MEPRILLDGGVADGEQYRARAVRECRQYLLRQAYEEAIDADIFICCGDSLGFDPECLYGMYDRIPSIEPKDEFVVGLTRSLDDREFQLKRTEDVRGLLRDLVGFGVDLTNQIRREHSETWTEEFGREVRDLVETAVDLEQHYAREACPEDVPGMGPRAVLRARRAGHRPPARPTRS